MTSTVSTQDGGPPAPSSAVPRRALRRVLGVVVVGVVLVAVAIAGERWRTGLHDFLPPGATESGPVPVGSTGYVDAEAVAAATVRVRLTAAKPVVTVNTADATVRVVLCRTNRAHRFSEVGFLDGNLHGFCSPLSPFSPGVVTLGGKGSQLLVAVTPRRPGTVHISGIRVSYRSGWRSGTQLTGTVIRVHVPAA